MGCLTERLEKNLIFPVSAEKLSGLSASPLINDLAGTSVLYTLCCLEALHQCLLAKGYLKWPDTTEREKIARAFGQVSPFACLVGLMDGTQIEVEYIPGRDDALLWYGRKNKYGFNVLIIIDHECCIQ